MLVKSHGLFSRGKDCYDAVHNAVILEEAAFVNYHAVTLSPKVGIMQQELPDRHCLRKHGANAY